MVQETMSLPGGKKRGMLRARYLLIALIAVLAVSGSATGGVLLWANSGGGNSQRVVVAVNMAYPQGWVEQPLSEADRNAGLLLNLENPALSATFLGRTVLGRLSEDFNINQLLADTEVALSSQIEDFDLISSEVTNIAGFDAVRVYYRQESARERDPFQTMMVIVPTESQTFYLTLRAEKDSFTAAQRDASQMISDFLAFVSRAP